MAHNSRRHDNIELDLSFMNNDSLARKAYVMQYPNEGQARPARRGVENQRRSGTGINKNVNRRRGEGQNVFRGNSGPARRNPYLADYNSHNDTAHGVVEQRKRKKDEIDLIWGEEIEHPIRRIPRTTAESVRETRTPRTTAESVRETRTPRTTRVSAREPVASRPSGVPAGAARTAAASGRTAVRSEMARPVAPGAVTVREQRRRMQQEKRRREALQRKLVMGIVEIVVLAAVGILVFMLVHNPKEEDMNIPALNPTGTQQVPEPNKEDMVQGLSREVFDKHPEWTTDYLTPNEYSRPGDPLGKVTNLFVHYTANKNTSAKQNRSYFEQLKDTHERGASAHFIIGYEGEIIQCVPLDEIAYAVATRNEDSISIECCFKSDDGSFTQETYDSLIALLSWLTDAYGLQSEDILRHYDCGGKKCPIYYTENEDAWEKLKADVRDYTL